MKKLVLAILVLLAVGAAFGASHASAKTDPAAAAKLASNIAFSCTAPAPDWCFDLTQKDGGPFVEVIDGDAYVHYGAAMDGAPIATEACHAIAAITNDGDTAKPLGLTSVVLLSNGKTAAQCFPPKT